jgi:predicted dehydrogenase
MIDVGLVGFGLAGRCFHAPVIRAVPGLRLAAIVERSGDSAARLFPNTPVVRTLDDLLRMASLKLIVIATPNQWHFPMAQRCLEAGRHVVVDKPFTTTVAEARELIALAGAVNRILTVYHDRRFDADFQGLRKVVASGALGRILRFESTYDRYRPAAKPGAWREQPGPGSGVLFDLGPHLLDQSFMLLGTPEAITADIRTERSGFSTDDAFDLLLHYPAGERALLRATMLAACPRPRTVVLAQNGSYRKRDFDPLELTLRAGPIPEGDSWALEKEENWGELTLIKDGLPTTRRVPSIGDWRDFYANVRDAIVGAAPLMVTPQQILDVMLAIELAVRSSAERRTLPWRRFDA